MNTGNTNISTGLPALIAALIFLIGSSFDATVGWTVLIISLTIQRDCFGGEFDCSDINCEVVPFQQRV